MDAFAMHGYQDFSDIPPSFLHPLSTTIALPDYGKLVAELGSAFDGTAQAGSSLPIVYTEFGAETTVPAAGYTGTEVNNRLVSPERQGEFYVEALKLAHCQPNVRGLLFFLVSDEPRLEGWQSGVRYADDSPKASLGVVRDAGARSRAGTLTTCPDTAAPTVELTAPTAVGGPVTLSATASDEVGVGKVEFLVDGRLVGSDARPPYSLSWTPRATDDGPVTITARALDGAGNAGTDSQPATVGELVYAAGDIADCDSDGDEATAALLDARPNGTVLTLGDTVYDNGTAAEFAACYDPSWGRHKARTRPAVGNHEYGTAGAGPYFDYFGAAAGERGKGWYSFDLGAWHVVVLNSNCAEVGCGVGSEQEEWLRADLAAHPASCTLAAWHHPRFSSGSEHGNQPQVQPLYQALYEAGADLLLTGHDHHYERFAPLLPWAGWDDVHGVRQFVVGTGGKSLRPIGVVRLGSEARDASTDGILQLTLHGSGYAWEFVPEAGGTFADTGSDECSTTVPAPWTQPFVDAVLEDRPVAHWRLGDPSGSTLARNSVGGAPDGSATGVEFGVAGALTNDPDRAARFPGTAGSGVLVPDAAAFDAGTSDFTVEAWVRTTANGEQVLVGKGSDAGPHWRLTVTDDTGRDGFGPYVGRARFRIADTGPPTVVYGPLLRIDDGKWHHVVAAVERAWGVHLYVDGAELGGFAQVGDVSNAAPFAIGAAAGTAPAFAGDLDEVAYYDELLAAERVRAHHLGGRRGDAPAATPPETILEAGPSTTTPLPQLTFSADEPATFECQLDGGPWTPCTSPYATQPLAPGPHSFAVRARDEAGLVDPSSAARELRVVPTFALDFGGTPDADPAVWRPGTGAWHVSGSPTTFFGRDGDVPVPGQWDSDPSVDVAVWRPASGGWYVQGSPTAFLGLQSDVPVPADYDADGTLDRAVWRPASGGWYRQGQAVVFFGRAGDVPVPGQWDDDPQLDVAVWRPSTGGWYVQGSATVFHGLPGDIPVPADYDGDGKFERAVFRASTGRWYVSGRPTFVLTSHRAGDVPVPGNWDADPEADAAVWRPQGGVWFVEGRAPFFLGRPTDVP
jgi:hypothetical protein